jgi:predicted dithiol-disulfide oxidoreductase (DUF899 family)
MQNRVASHEEWLKARLELLDAEKEFTRQRDALTRRRMAMPWERVEKSYQFEGLNGTLSLADLFDECSRLIVYHFMFAPDWEEGCKSSSFWADNFNGIAIHLHHRDVTFTAVSCAPLAMINAYRRRMGWSFPWVSSFGSDFNFDYHASFASAQIAEGKASYKAAARTSRLVSCIWQPPPATASASIGRNDMVISAAAGCAKRPSRKRWRCSNCLPPPHVFRAVDDVIGRGGDPRGRLVPRERLSAGKPLRGARSPA